jgi:2-desacetyl-2-hydroxyethyl bacteriochlorophyllide A dehydrogenase
MSTYAMKQKIKAVVFPAANQVKVQEFELQECGPEDVLVRSIYSMVSSGTELRCLGGDSHFPMIPGYAVIGEIIALGEKVTGYRVGDLITGRSCPRFVLGINQPCGGHASHHVFPATGEDRPVLLPQGAKPLDYVMAEPGSISLRGVDAAWPQVGETAVVIGQGLIGALSAGWLHARGCRVVVSDFEERRLDRAMGWGALAAVKGSEPDAEARIRTYINQGADIVVESSGASGGAMLAYSLVRPTPRGAHGSSYYRGEPIQNFVNKWPRLVMQASYDNKVTVHPHGFFPGEGITVITPSDRSWQDRQRSVEGIRKGEIKASSFLDKVISFEEAPTAYFAMRDDKNAIFSLVFDWAKA